MRSINPALVTAIGGIIVIVIGILVGGRLIPVIPEVAAGPILGSGLTLVAVGVSELLKFYMSTTKLEKPILDIEKLGENYYRVSALIYNPANITIKDAMAVLTVYGEPKELREMLDPCSELKPNRILVNKINPRIVGEALPWALPVKPISRSAGYIEYAHITSITPHQRARLFLFDLASIGGGYLIGFFSEYSVPGLYDSAPKYYRACLHVYKDMEIKAKVYVSGKGLKKPLEFCLKISKDILDEVMIRLYRADENIKNLEEAIEKLQSLLNC